MSKDTSEPQFDHAKYEAVQTYLKSAYEHMLAAGRSVRDFSEFTLEKFGDSFLPYLRRFLADVGDGHIKIKGLSKAAKSALLGTRVSPEERVEMIRATAYARAERRGFIGGSPQEDWLEAEREVDERLAKEVGLVARGHKALASATTVVEKELGSIKQNISAWIERDSKTKPSAKKRTTRKKTESTAS